MRIVVIGGSGLIGSRLVTKLRAQGQEAVAAAPESGVDRLASGALADTLAGAAVLVDVSEPPCVEDSACMGRFTSSTRARLAEAAAAGVRHHVALSAIGVDRLAESAYFRARLTQESAIRSSSMPYSIVRAAPLFETLGRVADASTPSGAVRVPPTLVQPVAADDVVRLLAEIAVAAPRNETVEVGGPEPFYLTTLVQRVLGARQDARDVVADVHARYLGADVSERSLVADDEAELGEIRFEDWLRESAARDAGVSGGASATRSALGPHEFRVSDVPDGSVKLLGDVAVFSVMGGFCATQALCTHRAGPLSEGAVDDLTVTCPLHGSQFNIWTGAVLRGPATEPLRTYRVTVEGDIGRVDVDERPA